MSALRMQTVVLILVLASYNNLINLWSPFRSFLYLPVNLTAGALLAVAALTWLDLEPADLGLAGNDLEDVALGAGMGLLVVAPLLAAAAWPASARLIADARVAGISGRALAFEVLVRIPLGTALFEEFAFRGILFAVSAAEFGGYGASWSSVAFGLWHVTPTLNLVRANRPEASVGTTLVAVAAGVLLTTGAGVALASLRQASEGLAAPIALHAVVNSVATVAAVLAHRLLENENAVALSQG